jgi:hypothetical protein
MSYIEYYNNNYTLNDVAVAVLTDLPSIDNVTVLRIKMAEKVGESALSYEVNEITSRILNENKEFYEMVRAQRVNKTREELYLENYGKKNY